MAEGSVVADSAPEVSEKLAKSAGVYAVADVADDAADAVMPADEAVTF